MSGIRELDAVIHHKGFVYTQVFKDDVGYIYSQEFNGNLLGYEVFLRKVNTLHKCVSFPTDKAFGKWAWSCRTLERAKGYLNI